MAAYLFTHFIGESEDGEQIYFSVSEDGLNFEDLNDGNPILYSKLGEQGVRDPYIVKHPKTGMFYLFATDLRIASEKGWKVAVEEGSRDMIVWESRDLVHWSEERACTMMEEGAGCVWAPEAIYDEKEEAFLVFWASTIMVDGENYKKHCIFAAYTNDFKEFSKPFKFIEKEKAVIDTTIIYSNNKYYRFTKDETTSRIIMEVSNDLLGEYYQIQSTYLENKEGVEGPECYLLPDRKTWCLILDRFASSGGYVPVLISDLDNGIMEESSVYHLGKTKKRHGCVMEITKEELIFLKEGFTVLQ